MNTRSPLGHAARAFMRNPVALAGLVGLALIVIATLGMGGAVLAEAALSFLGLGIRPPFPSWGSMLSEARARLADALDGDRDVTIGPAPDVLIEQAVARYDAVLEVFPEHVDALLEQGVALAHFARTMPDGTIELRVDEAIAALEHARRIDPERDAGAVSFELAVLYTRRGDLAHAEREYAAAYARLAPYPVAVEHPISPLFSLRQACSGI